MRKDTKLIESYLGKTLKEVEKLLASEGKHGRVMRLDGKVFFGTCNYRLDRVNLEIDNGIVTNAWLG